MLCFDMPRISLFRSLFIIIISLGRWLNTKATPSYLYHFCSNETTFAPNSTYQSNLNSLLSSLSSNATTRKFHSATAATARDPSSTSYGLFLCRGDVSRDACRECVVSVTNDVVERCPVETETVIWYDQCLLRYSNLSFFGTMDQAPSISLLNTGNVIDQSRLNELVAVTMKEAAAEAVAKGGAEKYFATRVANFTGFQTLYSLVQCTPDLSSSDCNMCLGIAIGNLPSCCGGKIGGRALMPSCNVRYELYPFYNQSASSPPSTATPPPLQNSKGSKISSQSSVIIVAIVGPIVVSMALFVLVPCLLRRRWNKNKYNPTELQNDGNDDMTAMESLQFDFSRIEAATNKFAFDRKLGGGGFGEVYRGNLPDGREIVVKRLSKSSRQGLGEFKNEVVLLAGLQHRNLVRLLGFCLEGEEKLLVYEFVPNKSLDYFLFDPKNQGQSDWPIRIDKNMNPKVSDFGMAKMFGVDQTEGNTKRIVGTYGYMAPEYAMEGLYSIKSDIFSFGVLLLEILSSRKNSSFHITDSAPSLVAYAWQLWNEGKALDLVDPCLKVSFDPNEFMRYLHIALLCVQEDAKLRPSMSSVVLTLKSEAPSLSQPERPAVIRSRLTSHQKIIAINSDSVNEMTASDFHPR